VESFGYEFPGLAIPLVFDYTTEKFLLRDLVGFLTLGLEPLKLRVCQYSMLNV
jgi:hypothetical protein